MTLIHLFAFLRRSAALFQSSSRTFAVLFVLGPALAATSHAQVTPAGSAPQPIPGKLANGQLFRNFIAMQARHSQVQAAKSRFLASPYKRTFEPLLRRWATNRSLSQTSGMKLDSKSWAQSTPASEGLNFPGYAGAPFITAAPLSDANHIFVSINGDFNKDGKQDIATINNDGTLNVILNGGSGDFTQNMISYSDTSAVSSYPLIAYGVSADLNGDGYTDVVGMDVNNGKLLIWINNGNGGFVPAVAVAVSPSNGGHFSNGGAIAVGDVNGDGKLDVVAVSQSEGTDPVTGNNLTDIATQVFAGDGKGNLAAPTEIDSVLDDDYYTNYGQGLQLADMNGDGKPDLVLQLQGTGQNQENLVTVALNHAGKFAPFSLNNSSGIQTESGLSSDVVVADVNGDGHPDVLFTVGSGSAQYEGVVAVAFGDGTGALSAQGQTVAAGNIPYLATFALADVNGDGKLDIVTFNSGSVSIYLGTGKGTFSAAPNFSYAASDGTGDEQPAVADYNSDGKVDIVYVDSGLEVASFFAGNGDGTFRGAPVVSPGGVNPAAILVLGTGDINGDGIPDLLAYDVSLLYNNQATTPAVVSLLSDGKGNFKEVTALSAAAVDKLSPTAVGDTINFEVSPTVVDLNGDGRADIVFSTAGSIYTALANANGSFQTPAPVSGLQLDCFPNLTDAGNIDGTGHTSLVLAYPGDSYCGGSGSIPSGVIVLINDGRADFTASVLPVGTSLYQARLVDLDGDGYPDLALSDIGTYTYEIYTVPNLGAAATPGTNFDLTRFATVLSNYAVADILPGDYNGDGKQDLAFATAGQIDVAGNNSPIQGTEGVLLLPNQGSFTFGQSQLVAQGTSASWAEWSDVNQDGIPDLALTAASSEQFDTAPSFGLTIIPGLGGGVFGTPVNQVLPISNPYLFVGDFNGDGAPDAVVSGDYTGSLFLNRGGDSLILATPPAATTQGGTITLTATLKTTFKDFAPGGSVTFTSGGATLGVSTLANGVATLSYNVPTNASAGTNSIVATYSGDVHFNQASASASYAVTALAPAFTVQLNSASITLTGGQTGVATLTITSNPTFQGVVTLTSSVAGSSSGSALNVSINPASVTLAGNQSQQVSILLGTGSILSAKSKPAAGWKEARFAISIAAFVPIFLGRLRKRRIGFFASILLCASILPVAALLGCGSSSSAKTTRTVTVTATSSVAGTTPQTTTLTVNLQ